MWTAIYRWRTDVPRVLMVSPHFPPDSTGGTHRVRLLGAAAARARLGADRAHGRSARLRRRARSGARRQRARRSARRPRARVAGASHSARRHRRPRPARVRGLWREASQLAARERFDVVFITIYPAYTALLGPLLKRRFGVPFVLDYQDPWVGEWGHTSDRGRRRARFAQPRQPPGGAALEPIALRAADAVTAVSRATYRARTSAQPEGGAACRRGAADRLGSARLRAAAAAPRSADRRAVHISCIGTLPPTMTRRSRRFSRR